MRYGTELYSTTDLGNLHFKHSCYILRRAMVH